MPRIIEANELQNNKVSFGCDLISSETKLPAKPRNMNCKSPIKDNHTLILLPMPKFA
jgi:hypothetical protein